MSKVNAGQASSTLIPKYIGSDFDKVVVVADNIEDVAKVADNLEDLMLVMPYVEEIVTVAGMEQEVKTVARNEASVNTVAANVPVITTVADNIADVVAVGNDMDDVKAIVDDMPIIREVGENIDDVSTVADGMDYVVEVAEGLHGMPVTTYTGPTPPAIDPIPEGVNWFCTENGRTYLWYVDEDSAQWVESTPQSGAITVEGGNGGGSTVFAPIVNITTDWVEGPTGYFSGTFAVPGVKEEDLAVMGLYFASTLSAAQKVEHQKAYAWFDEVLTKDDAIEIRCAGGKPTVAIQVQLMISHKTDEEPPIDPPGNATVLDVMIVAGQSNSVGYSGTNGATLDLVPATNTYEYRPSQNNIKAFGNPVGEAPSDAGASMGYTTGGTWFTGLINHYTQSTGNSICVVPAGNPGVATSTYYPGAGNFNMMMSKWNSFKAWLDGQTDFTLGRVFLVWHQGESGTGDSNTMDVATKTAFDGFMDAIPELDQVFFCRIANNDACDGATTKTYNTALLKLHNESSYVLAAPNCMKYYFLNQFADVHHYDQISDNDLGKELGTNIVQYYAMGRVKPAIKPFEVDLGGYPFTEFAGITIANNQLAYFKDTLPYTSTWALCSSLYNSYADINPITLNDGADAFDLTFTCLRGDKEGTAASPVLGSASDKMTIDAANIVIQGAAGNITFAHGVTPFITRGGNITKEAPRNVYRIKKNGASLECYVNGLLKSTQAIPAGFTATFNMLGKAGTSEFLNGILSDVVLVTAETPPQGVLSVDISGTPEVGRTLTAVVNAGATPPVAYAWYANTSNSNSGGTRVGTSANQYVIQAADNGKYIYVTATGVDDVTQTSAQTAVVTTPVGNTFDYIDDVTGTYMVDMPTVDGNGDIVLTAGDTPAQANLLNTDLLLTINMPWHISAEFTPTTWGIGTLFTIMGTEPTDPGIFAFQVGPAEFRLYMNGEYTVDAPWNLSLGTRYKIELISDGMGSLIARIGADEVALTLPSGHAGVAVNCACVGQSFNGSSNMGHAGLLHYVHVVSGEAAQDPVTDVTITGNTVVGQTLTANVNQTAAAPITYEWYRNATATASGGTLVGSAKTYLLGAADENQYMYVIARGSNSSSATSTPTSAIVGGVTFNYLDEITGSVVATPATIDANGNIVISEQDTAAQANMLDKLLVLNTSGIWQIEAEFTATDWGQGDLFTIMGTGPSDSGVYALQLGNDKVRVYMGAECELVTGWVAELNVRSTFSLVSDGSGTLVANLNGQTFSFELPPGHAGMACNCRCIGQSFYSGGPSNHVGLIHRVHVTLPV